jgi:large subunit ribosomal protein L10
MDRHQKDTLISSLHNEFSNTVTVVVAHYAGLTVAEISSLRSQMREAGGSIKVVKNRLAKIASQGTSKECLGDILTGPTLMAFSVDPVAAARVVNDYAKKNQKLTIIGGVFEHQLLDVEGVKTLATMPSLDELRGKIVGLLQAPATKVAGVLVAPAGQLARVLRAYADKAA